ncbi:hypothetical protein EP7_001431 [Isosphaeraceae bacterium EP7]
MTVRGIVQAATLEENPADPDQVELVLRAQGVGPTHPRRLVVPYALLLEDESLEPEGVTGRAFEAEVEEDAPKRWVVRTIKFAARSVLRPESS